MEIDRWYEREFALGDEHDIYLNAPIILAKINLKSIETRNVIQLKLQCS